MTLTTHAIVGTAAAHLFAINPIISFSAGFVSHFLLDAIPHRDYRIFSMRNQTDDPINEDMIFGKDFLIDTLRIGSDFILGMLLAFLISMKFLPLELPLIFAGALGGIAPDALQFLYWKIRREPLTSLQKFHLGIQKPLNVPILISWLLQGLIVFAIIFAVAFFTPIP